MTLSARQTRELALLALYVRTFNPDMPLGECFTYLWANRSELRQILIEEELLEGHLDQLPKEALSLSTGKALNSKETFAVLHHDDEEMPSYFAQLVSGVEMHAEELDERLNPYISGNWHMGRIETLGRLILRLGAYELLYTDPLQVPGPVAVNEALELSKRYMDMETRPFINGILSKLLDANEA